MLLLQMSESVPQHSSFHSKSLRLSVETEAKQLDFAILLFKLQKAMKDKSVFTEWTHSATGIMLTHIVLWAWKREIIKPFWLKFPRDDKAGFYCEAQSTKINFQIIDN